MRFLDIRLHGRRYFDSSHNICVVLEIFNVVNEILMYHDISKCFCFIHGFANYYVNRLLLLREQVKT